MLSAASCGVQRLSIGICQASEYARERRYRQSVSVMVSSSALDELARKDLRDDSGAGWFCLLKCGLQSRLCQDVSCAIAFAIVVLVVLTQRLELRLPVERDRERFVQLFCDREFMVFSAGVLDREAANRRFDQMLIRAEEFPSPAAVIDRSTGQILGYSGVDRFEFEGRSVWSTDTDSRRKLGGEAIPQRLGERCSPRRPRPTEGTPRDDRPRESRLPVRRSQAWIQLLEAGASGRIFGQPLPAPTWRLPLTSLHTRPRVEPRPRSNRLVD